ncbi:STAS domain-containing protein [Paractinoplanes durhamensis]|uniref:STAS domain-containing protein n=1 Tax=Paractinoplanes durhamensis TaxID=113563 RepID=A0ABQ3ZDC5_9ACTN|nr:STAS domain-containing protein [Actinoplanes durhamensis]GIE07544.1 hypothetical protein Adu01nite_88940 [Actinoplanes durhamensis]
MVMGPQGCEEWKFGNLVVKIRMMPNPGDRILVIAVSGEIDIANAAFLSRWFFRVVGVTHVAQVDIDVSDVDFCDLEGVRALFSVYVLAGARGIECQIVNPRPHIAWLLDVADAGALIDRRPGG